MARKKKRNGLKKFQEGAIGMTTSGVTLGLGGSILGGIPGAGQPAAASGAKGLQRMGSMMPSMGTIMGAGAVIDVLKDIKPAPRKKRRR